MRRIESFRTAAQAFANQDGTGASGADTFLKECATGAHAASPDSTGYNDRGDGTPLLGKLRVKDISAVADSPDFDDPDDGTTVRRKKLKAAYSQKQLEARLAHFKHKEAGETNSRLRTGYQREIENTQWALNWWKMHRENEVQQPPRETLCAVDDAPIRKAA